MPRRRKVPRPWGLTNREWEIVQAIAAGATSRASLAEKFTVSPATIRGHKNNIRRKMEVRNDAEILLKMQAEGTAHASPS